MRRSFGIQHVALAVLTTAAACDPCSGTANCSTAPELSVEGQIVDAMSGAGVGGVAIDVLPRQGASTVLDSVSTKTDAEGFWHIEVRAGAPGGIIFDARVLPPSSPGYRVGALLAQTTDRYGEATQLGRWVTKPYFPFVGEMFLRATQHPIGNADVSFQRTAGPDLIGPGLVGGKNGLYQATGNWEGHFFLFETTGPRAVLADSSADVVGDFTAQLPAPYGVRVNRGFRLRPTYLYQYDNSANPFPLVRVGFGPFFPYTGTLLLPDSAPAANALITFHRTSGLALLTDTASTLTDAGGHFVFYDLVPLGDGTVTGDFIIQPPSPLPATIGRGFSLSTVDSDVVKQRALGPWFVGVTPVP